CAGPPGLGGNNGAPDGRRGHHERGRSDRNAGIRLEHFGFLLGSRTIVLAPRARGSHPFRTDAHTADAMTTPYVGAAYRRRARSVVTRSSSRRRVNPESD